MDPSEQVSEKPSERPTPFPSLFPSKAPSPLPSAATDDPSLNPSYLPSDSPLSFPFSSPPTTQPINNAPPFASSGVLDVSLERTGEQEYLNRLTGNLETSNTACEQVKQAMIQKTIAEETVAQGDKIYDNVMNLSLGLER